MSNLERPREVTALAAAAAWGAFTNAIPFLPPQGVDHQVAIAQSIGESPAVVVGSELLLLFLWIATGLGLWNGRSAGWWCAAFLYQAGVFRYGRLLCLDLFGALGKSAPLIGNHLISLVMFALQCALHYTMKPRMWARVSGWHLKWLLGLPFVAVVCAILLSTVAQLLLRP